MTTQSVLITTYPEAYLHKGGGEYELLEVSLNLRKSGVIADVYGPHSRDISYYGTVLYFSLVSSGLSLLQQVHHMGKKIILWPNFWAPKNHDASLLETIHPFFELAQAAVFKSYTELQCFEEIVAPVNIETLMVPAGVDSRFTESTPERLFRDSFGLEEYMLWIGILEPRKNQLEVIKALHDLPIPLVFVGNYRDQAYYDDCRAAAPDHFLFLEPMEPKSDILRAAIRECKLYIEPTLEPAGKSVLEAAICGARVLISDSPWEHEHFGDAAVYVNPKDVNSIREGVFRSLSLPPPDHSLVEKLSRKHLLPQALAPLITYLGYGS